MKTKNENIEALEDIVFEHRNKEYGAYQIRRRYNAMLNRATAISVMLMLMGLAYPLIASYYKQQNLISDKVIVTAELMKMETPPEELTPPPPPPAEALEPKAKFFAPVITDDSVPPNNAFNIDDLLAQIGNSKPGDTEFGIDTVTPPIVIDHPEDPTQIFTIVEENPYYTGGDEARLTFLRDNMQYPSLAREIGIQGTVYVEFVVNSHNKVTDVTLKRGIGGGCDEEAMRVVSMMNGWNAGRQGGKAVNVKFTIPVKFSLN